MSEAEIARLRAQIADVDREIVAHVAKRLHLAESIGIEKKLMDLPLRDPEAEERVFARLLAECATRGISERFAEGLSRLLIEESVRREQAILPPEPVEKRVLVVGGAGQMGRWFCRYLRSRGYDVLVNDTAGPLEDFPFERDLAKAVVRADIIAVSVPMSAAADVLRSIGAMRPKALVFDLCSLKAPVEKVLREMGASGLKVASVHPMFGPDLWPLSTGAITFSDCGHGVAVLEAKELFRASGASFVDLSLDHHDEFMGFLLSLSHLCLLTFARSVSKSPFDLAGLRRPAGTTFSRLSVAAMGLLDDPALLLRDIQALNPHTPAIRRRIREVLDDWERATEASDPKSFIKLIEQSLAYFGGGPA
jgi:chorismate mutase/prephenate dehydrogenase